MASSERDQQWRQCDDALLQLLHSIAHEEESISKLLRTETDKMNAFTGNDLDFPSLPSTTEIIRYNQTLVQLLDSVLMSKWLTMKKLDMVLLHRVEAGKNGLNEGYSAHDDAKNPGIDY